MYSSIPSITSYLKGIWSTTNGDVIEFKCSKPRKRSEPDQKKILNSRIKRFTIRLQKFIDAGIWKVRSEITMSDEDDKLQKVLIYISGEHLEIKGHAKKLSSQFKASEEYLNLEALVDAARNKIQSELKMRQARREKRKLVFLLE